MSNREIIDQAIAQIAEVNTPEHAQEFILEITSLEEEQAVAYISRIFPLWFDSDNQPLGERVY